jgi:hypothetical protein
MVGNMSWVDKSEPPTRPTQSQRLVGLTDSLELWHTPELEALITLEISGHEEQWPVRSRGFNEWLARSFYTEYRSVPNSQAKQDALSVIEGKAIYEGDTHDSAVRLAEQDGVIYLDLSNEGWEVVEITSTGWTIIPYSPVKFMRKKGMQKLPRPEKGGSITDLRRFINIQTDSDWLLCVAWLLGAIRPNGPYPVLVLHGEQGSAKSTAARVLKRLLDPNMADLRSEPKEPRDLMIAASNSWCIGLDNISRIPAWLSDALCRLSTGGGFGTRTLYQNDEETIFDAKRPIILNGIEEIAVRGDLLDRAIVLYLPSISKQQRRSERDFWQDFDRSSPWILGAVLDAVVMALRDVDEILLGELPRMADFAMWSVASMPALGFDPGSFMDAYNGNRDGANSLVLESSPIYLFLQAIADKEVWQGTATELLDRLNRTADDLTQRQRSWPKSARAVSNALRRLAPNLREAGIDVIHEQTSGTRSVKSITIRKVGESFDAIDACDATEVPASQKIESVAGFPPVSKRGPLVCSCPRQRSTPAKFMKLACNHGEGYGCPACGGCRNPACSSALAGPYVAWSLPAQLR